MPVDNAAILGEVGTGTEGAARTRQHHHANVVVRVDFPRGADELAPQAGIEGVEVVRSIEGYQRNVAGALDKNGAVIRHQSDSLCSLGS